MKEGEIRYVVIRADKAGMQTLSHRLSRLGRSIGFRADAGALDEMKELVSDRERELADEVADLRRRLAAYEGPIGGVMNG